MNSKGFGFIRRRASVWAAVLVLALVAGGASWHGFAAEPQTTAVTVAAQSVARTVSPVVAGGRESYADVVRAVAPAVVEIRVRGRAMPSRTGLQEDDLFRRFFGEPRQMPMPRQAPPRQGVGSGVIVSPDGYVLTNHHVVRNASEIEVELPDNRTFSAEVIGSDEASDLALIKVNATSLPVVPIGDSNAVAVGDVVLAIGNPLNIGQTVTMGIVSAKGRSTGPGDGSYEDFLQTDAAINQGNSGGALVNLRGELVGINSQILSPSGGNIGIGFAIPSNMARHVMDELRTEGRVRRSQLGVVIQPLNADIAASLGLSQTSGAIVSSVTPDSPASRAGLEQEDVIVSFNGQPVTDTNAFRNRVAETKPGSTVTLGVIRDGKERTITATLGEAQASRRARSDQSDERADQAALGVSVAPLTPELKSRAGIPDDVTGLLVQQVAPQGRAAGAGIQAGDVIRSVNRTPVRTVEDLQAAVKSNADRPTLLLVNREGRDLFVAVRPS